MENIIKNKEFLQSAQWRKFQENVGRKTYVIKDENFYASVIEHSLPIVGKYFYCPRGPEGIISNFKSLPQILHISKQAGQISNEIQNKNDKNKNVMHELVDLAKKNNAGWIRIDLSDDKSLKFIRENIKEKVVKAPHDMQPKEVFVLEISKSDEQLLAEMKSKTRYNIILAKKKGVIVKIQNPNDKYQKNYLEEFLKLTKEMSQRQGIVTHSAEYYRKMVGSFPKDMLEIYVAEYEGEIIAANLVVFYGDTATYLHGASSNENRNVMAPYLLQWQAILDAKEKGYTRYDFGGVRTVTSKNTWEGITNFKLGFSPMTKPLVFPGSYDIVINPRAYALYRGLQRAKAMLHKFHK